jgi:SNF2 family DNA or RNA helicase
MHLKPLWPGFDYFPHQEVSVKWMLEKEKIGTPVAAVGSGSIKCIYGGLQCDDMGLGKTMQICGAMKNNVLGNTLILVPLAMVQTWIDVLIKSCFNVFVPKISYGGKGFMKWTEYDSEGDVWIGAGNVYVCNYDKILHNSELFMNVGKWQRIVLDEAHRIRNPKSILAQEIMRLKADVKWAVTGTPVINSLRDLCTLFHFLGITMGKNAVWNDALKELIGQFLIHRPMSYVRGVIDDAPPEAVVKKVVLPFLTPEEEEFYKGVQGVVEGRMSYYKKDIASVTSNILIFILRLRQISVHPLVYIESNYSSQSPRRKKWEGIASTKIVEAGRLVREEPGKYIIFCQFHREMELIEEYLREECGIEEGIYQYHGGLSASERVDVLRRAKGKECGILLLQLHSGGVGLNLQEFNKIIFMGPWWTDALMNQAIARAVRIGQKEVVNVYHLFLGVEDDGVCKDIDTYMASVASQKGEMLKKVFECRHVLE